MKYLRKFENISDEFRFAVNVKDYSDEQKLEALDMMEKSFPIRFNGSQSKKRFIDYRDQSGKAWCWLIEIENRWQGFDKGYGQNIYISGVHTFGWFDRDRMKNMITLEKFLKIGIENIETYFTAKNYNL
jgi:hypothetical protein